MTGSILALLVGLVLLGLAVLLLHRANSPSSSYDANGIQSGLTAENPGGEPAEEGRAQGSATDGVWGVKDGQDVADHGARDADVDDADVATGEDAHDLNAADGESVEQDARDLNTADEKSVEQDDSESPKPGEAGPVGTDGGVAEASPARMGKGFASVRKRRKTWAQAHGFEYLREDKRLAGSWPWFLVGGDEESIPPATDVVSGFSEGHSTHIADVNGKTLLAMRRDAYSPVEVQFTEGEAMPEGMRRSEPLDQPPYVAYTTDVRALDRMLDLRVEDALASLSQVASDVVWSGDWVLLRISRKLDTSVWDEILPHVRSLVDAAMVLPPEHVNIPLEMDHADQTRAMPGGALSIDVHANLVAAGAAEEATADGAGEGEGAVRGHLRAMPDVGASSRASSTAEAGAEGASAGDADAQDPGGKGTTEAAETSAYSDTVGPDDTAHLDEDRPEITRPAEPVVFPSRSDNHLGRSSHDDRPGRDNERGSDGADAWSSEFFKGADIFDDDDDDDGSDHINRRLPRLGEDPDHTSQSTAGYSQVIRSDADHEATIFFDYEDDEEDGDQKDFTDSNHVLRAAAEPVDVTAGENTVARGDADVVEDGFADTSAEPVDPEVAADDATRDSELTNVAKLRRDRRRARRAAGGGGRHRAPDARHARPEPIEAVEVEIETVDAEIVEDEK